MKKRFSAIILFMLLGLVSKGFCWTETVARTDDTFNILLPYTTAAFSVYLTSVPATASGKIYGIISMYYSTATFSLFNALGGATSYYFNRNNAGCDTLNEFVSSITATGYFTATLSQGAYGDDATYKATSSTVGYLAEGYVQGLQWEGYGRDLSISTGTDNAKTIYSNVTQYQCYRKAPIPGRQNVLGYIVTTSSFNGATVANKMSVYEGVLSTNCLTRISPEFDISTQPGEASYFVWADPFNLIGTKNYAQEYRFYFSTFVVGGDIYIIGKSKKQ